MWSENWISDVAGNSISGYYSTYGYSFTLFFSLIICCPHHEQLKTQLHIWYSVRLSIQYKKVSGSDLFIPNGLFGQISGIFNYRISSRITDLPYPDTDTQKPNYQAGYTLFEGTSADFIQQQFRLLFYLMGTIWRGESNLAIDEVVPLRLLLILHILGLPLLSLVGPNEKYMEM